MATLELERSRFTASEQSPELLTKFSGRFHHLANCSGLAELCFPIYCFGFATLLYRLLWPCRAASYISGHLGLFSDCSSFCSGLAELVDLPALALPKLYLELHPGSCQH